MVGSTVVAFRAKPHNMRRTFPPLLALGSPGQPQDSCRIPTFSMGCNPRRKGAVLSQIPLQPPLPTQPHPRAERRLHAERGIHSLILDPASAALLGLEAAPEAHLGSEDKHPRLYRTTPSAAWMVCPACLCLLSVGKAARMG